MNIITVMQEWMSMIATEQTVHQDTIPVQVSVNQVTVITVQKITILSLVLVNPIIRQVKHLAVHVIEAVRVAVIQLWGAQDVAVKQMLMVTPQAPVLPEHQLIALAGDYLLGGPGLRGGAPAGGGELPPHRHSGRPRGRPVRERPRGLSGQPVRPLKFAQFHGNGFE